MARRSVPPPKPKPPVLTVGQKRRRIERLQKCMQRLDAFDPQKVQRRVGVPEVLALDAAIDKALSSAFGHGTPAYLRYNLAATLDHGPLQLPRCRARSCVQLADQEGAKRRLKKRANTFPRARSARSPCCGKRSAHLKAKSPMRNRSRRRHKNPKALLTRITRHRAPRWPKPPRRQPKFGRSIPDSGAASISKRRGVVWENGGEVPIK
jgi:hypothetical protein